MATLLHISEILNFAIEREQQSYELYKELAEKTEDQKLKNVFHILMDEEVKHKEHYARVLNAVDQKQTPGVTPDEEYHAYMLTLIESARTVRSLTVDINNLKEAVDYAIEREKDAVLFYVGLEQFVPEKDRGEIQNIIREEGTHIVKLTNLKKDLSSF